MFFRVTRQFRESKWWENVCAACHSVYSNHHTGCCTTAAMYPRLVGLENLVLVGVCVSCWTRSETRLCISSWFLRLPVSLRCLLNVLDFTYFACFNLSYEVHGMIRRSSSFNTCRIDHLYKDRHEKGVRC